MICRRVVIANELICVHVLFVQEMTDQTILITLYLLYQTDSLSIFVRFQAVWVPVFQIIVVRHFAVGEHGRAGGDEVGAEFEGWADVLGLIRPIVGGPDVEGSFVEVFCAESFLSEFFIRLVRAARLL